MTVWTDQVERWVRHACIAEVNFHKPGNVTPNDSYPDACIDDFLRSADAVAPILAEVTASTVGATILQAAQATHDAVGHNTNLGILLLITPLAAVSSTFHLQAGIHAVLNSLTVDDAVTAYKAIAVANPSGLGDADSQDVSESPTLNLRECMVLAADRDLIAAQYGNGFFDVLDTGQMLLKSTQDWPEGLAEWRLAFLAVSLISRFGDSLIRRKCGAAMDRTVQHMATQLLQSNWPLNSISVAEYHAFDRFLRADGHRRNPGTTADMIAAILFAAFRDGLCEFSRPTTTLSFIDPKHD